MKGTILILGLFISQFLFPQQNIYEQNFDSGGFPGGANYSVPYQAWNAVRPVTSTSNSPSTSIRFRRRSWMTNDIQLVTDNIPLTGFQQIQLSIAYSSDGSLQNNNDLILDYSLDGGTTWIQMERLIRGRNSTTGDVVAWNTTNGNTAATNPYLNDISTNFPAATQIQFRVRLDFNGGHSGPDPLAFIDDIYVTGIPDYDLDITGNTVDIIDDSTTISVANNTDFGRYDISAGSINRTYTITNNGWNTANFGPVVLSGDPVFSVVSQPAVFTLDFGCEHALSQSV